VVSAFAIELHIDLLSAVKDDPLSTAVEFDVDIGLKGFNIDFKTEVAIRIIVANKLLLEVLHFILFAIIVDLICRTSSEMCFESIAITVEL
jgi:hypothetical protein